SLVSKASMSRVTLTEPSIAFSMATNPTSTSPASVAASTSGIEPMGTSCAPARSGCVSSASSVNVPVGPRKPTRIELGSVSDGGGTDAAAAVTTEQDSDVDEPALRELLDAVRSGAVSADDAVARLRRLPFAD